MLDFSNLVPSALLPRKDCAKALTEAGYPVSPKTLASMATRGGGPGFHKFGNRVLYRWADALDWAEARLRGPIHSSSELDDVRDRSEP
jgi:hypothetical protein